MDFFVYGTLCDPDRAATLLDTFEYGPSAHLDGLRRVAGRYPTLAPGGTTEGRLLRTDEVGALDEYEGVEGGLYVRVGVPWAGDRDDGEVQVYVGDPGQLSPVEPVEWPGDGPLRERIVRYVREEDVEVRIIDEEEMSEPR